MPVPLTSAALILSGIFMAGGLELPSIIVGSAGVINQALVEFAAVMVSRNDR